MDEHIHDKWNNSGEPFDPTEAATTEDAVFIGSQATGDTVIIGREDDGEWITTRDMGPLTLAEYI